MPHPIFVSLAVVALLATIGTGAEPAPKQRQITISELNEVKVIGVLGHPIPSIHKIQGEFVDGSSTRAKADQGQTFLRVTHVDDVELPKPVQVRFSPFGREKHLTDGTEISILPGKPRRKLIGKKVVCRGYESLQTHGTPHQAFQYVESVATTGYGYSSELVILKVER